MIMATPRIMRIRLRKPKKPVNAIKASALVKRVIHGYEPNS